MFFAAAYAYAGQGNTPQQALKPGMTIVKSAPVRVSQPLRSLAPARIDPSAPSAARTFQDRQLIIPKTRKGKESGRQRPASIVQDRLIRNAMPAAAASFEGIGNVSGVLPPDTQGDIGWDPATGKKYYVQWVNLAYQMWDVTVPAAPVSLVGPVAGNTLWTGMGGLCESHNDGDPLTRFDALSNRWVMSQFALGFPDNFHQCIAVSQTADPTGPWYLYDFQTSTSLMNDYGKVGVWPDGYYMSFNQFNGSSFAWAGAGVAVFEREKMLLGESARMIYLDLGAVSLDYSGMLPSDLDGPTPAVGTPNYFMEWDDSAWMGDATDTLRVWEFRTDWTVPANSTFGADASYTPNALIPTADVDPNMCFGARSCIPQPGTTQGLDAISDRLMYRLQYRNFGTHQTLVANHTVDANGADQAGIHWFELRNTGAGFAMNQEGVYAPDGDNRWMGSVAMDVSGDMALGFSVSSSATYPSVRYTGRLATEPTGTLTQGEASLIVGTGSQTSTSARWGDYSMMAVDPSDGCTFWYTQEYYATTGSSGWQTRIGSFKFPSCTTAPTGVLSGTVDDGTNPIAGATIDVSGGYSTVTDAAGHYAIKLVAGTYSVTASKYGYVSSTVPGVVVTPPGVTTQDFVLAVAPLFTISGVVTDATAGWPLYARITIAGYPGGPVFTNPVTGAYSVGLTNGAYTFTVSALSSGYTSTVLPLVVAGEATRDLALAADTVACNAPGYQVILGSTLSSDGFDTSTAPAFPANWSVVDVTGTTGDWVTRTTSTYPPGIVPRSAPNMAVFNSWTASSGNTTRLYQTSGLDLSAQPSGEVSFWMYHEAGYTAADTVQVQVSTNAGVSWNNVGAPIARYDTSTGWVKHRININAYTGIGMTDVRVGFLGISAYGNDIHIDDMVVSTASVCAPNASTGLVVGAVYDANTGTSIPDSDVADAINHALFVNNSADAGQPHPMYIIAEPAGAVSLTASARNHGTDTHSPTVVAGHTVRQDFNLAVAILSADPASLTFHLTTAAPIASLPFSLDNTGGIAATYELFTAPGAFAGYAPSGPFAAATRHTGPKNLSDWDASKLRVPPTRSFIPPLAAGDVSASWPTTGLTYPYGIGFNTDANDLWLGTIFAAGGGTLDYRFTTAGVNTGDTIDTASWVSSFAADMTYNPFTKSVWQINTGGNNCIYELDPAAKTSTGNKICPAFGTSQRGLAFDPVTNTYYSGSWNDFILNHFAPDGTILDSMDVNLAISGLAFNPVTRRLFVLSNTDSATTPTNYDVTVLDTANSYAVVGGFNLMSNGVNAFADYEQGGLEMDCDGNLWAVDYMTQIVYTAASGETGVCNWQPGWLTVTPPGGSVTAGGTAALTASVDATGFAVGTYSAYVRVVNNSPYGSVIVPVTLNVTDIIPDGDLDGGGVAASDALKALRFAVGLDIPVASDFNHGDVAPLVNGTPQPDSKIDVGDVVVILRKAVGLVAW